MSLSIGLRTVKTAVGVTLAVSIAQLLGLDQYASAGMLAILCIQSTKKQSLITSRNRFLGSFITIALSYLLFEGIAFHPVLIGCLLFIYIPISVYFNMTDSIVTSAVVGLHLYSYGYINLPLILNEVAILSIGITVALGLNLFMPNLDGLLDKNQKQVDENFKKIFKEIVNFLTNSQTEWSGKELLETEKLIKKSKKLAIVEQENRLFDKNESYYAYFQLRDQQLAILERVLPYIASIPDSLPQSKLIARFITEMTDFIHSGAKVDVILDSLYDLREDFKKMELPKTREEFEIRASLFYFVQEMEQYLVMKQKYHEQKKRD